MPQIFRSRVSGLTRRMGCRALKVLVSRNQFLQTPRPSTMPETRAFAMAFAYSLQQPRLIALPATNKSSHSLRCSPVDRRPRRTRASHGARATAYQQNASTPALRSSDPESPVEKLCTALASRLSGVSGAADMLASAISADCTWDTPLFAAQGRADIQKNLESFVDLFLDSTVLFTSIQAEGADSRTVMLDWLLSFTYPLPWRPRVTVSGCTRLTLSAPRPAPSCREIMQIRDTWDVPVWNVVYQVLPRVSDILWVYPSPHAETDSGTRRLLSRQEGYFIMRAAARPVLLVQAELPKEDQIYVRAVPALPSNAYVGGLRRLEDYATVSPISVRCVSGNLFEWEIPVPGNMFGNGAIRPPDHPSPNARFTMSRPRVFAVVRYRGYALVDKFQSRVEALISGLRTNGVLRDGDTVDQDKVWARSYDSKVGFNTKGLLAIATYGTTRGIPPRVNEIAIELPDDTNAALLDQ